jgi:dTDP-4-dehydrorhamnose 3,5-epimerase
VIKAPDALPGVLTLEPDVYSDERGFFMESYNERDFAQATGLAPRFVQDNHSYSTRNVLRGMHYQVKRPQGKLVRVVSGEIFDVAIDVRRGSPTLGRWSAVRLSAENKRMRWIPEGYAHGFLVVSEAADVLYKTTDYRVADLERAVAWSDPDLKIAWPMTATPILSARDARAPLLKDAELIA